MFLLFASVGIKLESLGAGYVYGLPSTYMKSPI